MPVLIVRHSLHAVVPQDGRTEAGGSGGTPAKAYYDYLIEGKYEAYIDGFYQPDSIPGSYREQLIVNAKQYAAQMKEDHGGLAAVKVAGAKADTARHTGHAFLVLCFKDSTKEEIVVPMALVEGNWMMK